VAATTDGSQAKDPSEDPDSVTASDVAKPHVAIAKFPSGWVTLIRNHWLIEFSTTGFWFSLWAIFLVHASNALTGELPIALRILAWVASLGVGLVAILLWYRLKPEPQANFDTSEIRRGRRVHPMGDIRWAKLLVVETKKSRSITLQFGLGTLSVGSEAFHRGIASYAVRTERGLTPPTERAQLVAEVLRRSSIELPQTPEDPTGKFTWFNFPGSITREQAIDVVLNPPAIGDPLPVPSNHMYDPPRPGTTNARSKHSGKNK
jgi:hypothetical protein